MKDTSGRSSVTPANQWRCTAARVGQRELTLNEAVIWTSMSPCWSGLPCVKLHSSNSPNLFRLLWIWACRALSWSRACVCVWVFATSELVGHVDRTLNVVAALPQIECTLYSEPKFDCHLSKWKKAPKEESRVSRETAPFVQTTEPLHCFIPVSSLFAVIRVLFAEWFPTQHVSLVCLSFPNLENPWTTASKCKNNSRDSTSDESQTTRISRANWQFPKELDPKTGPELYKKKKTALHIHEPRLNKD